MKKPLTLLSSTLALTLFLSACSEEPGQDSGGNAAEEQTNEQTAENESAADTEDQAEENNESPDEQEVSDSENEETTEEQQQENTSSEEDASDTEEVSTGNSSDDSDTAAEENSSETEEASADTPADSDSSEDDTNATVTNVVDGDTIDVEYEGGEERIRLILVDTPETKHPQMGVQPFGPEATEFTTSELAGEDVRLELGVEERDYYDRLLAYVFVDGENFNQQLIEEGLARVAVYPPNTEYLDEFEAAEEEARSAGIGIWSIEDYVTDDGYEEQSGDEDSQESSGDSGSTDDSGSSDSGETSEDVYYENCDAARDAEAAPVREGDPGYGGHLDRDGDGVGCET